MCSSDLYLTDLLGNHAISSINSYAKSRTPFFISLHFNAPHWPWESPDDEAGSRQRYDAKGIASYDEGTLKIYASMVTRMDATVGRVLKALETNGVAGNTIVIFTSDNGGERFSDTWPFTGKKTELLEGGIRIPAIIRWPGRVRPRTTTAQEIGRAHV